MIRIALDAMGGDHAPEEVIKGAFSALQNKDIEVLLLGPKGLLETKLGDQKNPRLQIVDAPEIVGMSESPSVAFKKKKDSSIRRGIDMVKSGEADAFVSAGNTGAVMATATLVLGRIEGVERPAIATVLPTMKGQLVMLDMGSNVDSKPLHLKHFAIMGSDFSKLVLGVDRPRVGLLNIGEEPDKGDQLSLAAHDLLKDAPIHFIGNIESKHILFDTVDVVVCDGFVGNALLKFGEGITEFFIRFFKQECKRSVFGLLGALLLMPIIKKFKKKTDYEEFGGAPLLGVNGVTIIAHGSSHEKAIKNAIRTAYDAVKMEMTRHIQKDLEKGHE